MLTIRVLSLALTLLGFLALPVRAENPLLPGVLGVDDREPQETDGWPWVAIGRVNLAPKAGHCTGTLIAPDKVLTAAHCLYYGARRRWYLPSEVHFLAGYSRGTYYAHGRAKALYVAEGNTPAEIEHRRLGPDAAIIELTASISDIRPIPLASARPSAGQQVIRAGYSKDRAHLLSVDRACKVLPSAKNAPLIAHDCDATKGDSGSPLLLGKDDGTFVVTAISIAVATDKDGHRYGVGVTARAATAPMHALPENPRN